MAIDNPHLIWIDCEMTGLSLKDDALVEIAVQVTDSELNPIGDGIDILIATTPEKLAGMNEFVTNMHTESGLLPLISSGTTLADAEAKVIAHLESVGVESGKSPLAGNSIATDRNFIARDMPLLDAFLHYRIIDVSSIKELARRWYASAYFNAPKKTGNHRAMGDVKDSIEELKYYRSVIFAAKSSSEK